MSLTGKFDKYSRRKLPAKTEAGTATEDLEIESFGKAGYIRNLSIVLLGGEKQFFNYNDLTNGIYSPSKNTLILNFRGATTVTLKGRNLDMLYEKLLYQIPRQIACVDKRYDATKDEKEIVVHEIIITDLSL